MSFNEHGERQRAATRFTAAFDGHCVECDDQIIPGDEAGYIPGEDGVHCEDCLDEYDEVR